jgi:multisubunit Na+/H+ antiporter MnhG subunit
MFQGFSKMLMLFGLVILLIGAVSYFAGKLGLGRLPGDIVYRKGSFTFYFPLATSIIISIILTIIFSLFRLKR